MGSESSDIFKKSEILELPTMCTVSKNRCAIIRILWRCSGFWDTRSLSNVTKFFHNSSDYATVFNPLSNSLQILSHAWGLFFVFPLQKCGREGLFYYFIFSRYSLMSNIVLFTFLQDAMFRLIKQPYIFQNVFHNVIPSGPLAFWDLIAKITILK